MEIELDPKETRYNAIAFLRDEVERAKSKLPKSFDPIARFLAISRPIVSFVLTDCGDWTDEVKKEGPGKKPIAHASLMLIHMLAKALGVEYRQIERELKTHPTWLKALQLKKAPSHARLSTFRTEMGKSFFKAFFDNLTDLLRRFNLIKSGGAIVDSVPIVASVNFARANATPKINVERVREFFSSVDVSPAVRSLGISRKRKYDPASIIRFFAFEKLGGFLSIAQAIQFVQTQQEVAKILGFKNGQVPNQQSFNYFTRTHGSVPDLLKPLVDDVTDFFDCCEATPEDSDIDFFFWSF